MQIFKFSSPEKKINYHLREVYEVLFLFPLDEILHSDVDRDTYDMVPSSHPPGLGFIR